MFVSLTSGMAAKRAIPHSEGVYFITFTCVTGGLTMVTIYMNLADIDLTKHEPPGPTIDC